jgi:peptidoglycan-associated lipoprotein
MRRTLITVASSALLFGGCASTSEEPRTGAEAGQPGAASEAPRTRSQPFERKAMAGADLNAGKSDPAGFKAANGVPSLRTIYYDYDRYEIKDEYRRIVEAHAKYLRDNPSARMTIQGNADERGSREYNVGLGQRRSEGLKRALLLLGAKESQVESVSLGEEKPACTDHAENCWWKNRRGDIRYPGEY